MVSKSISWLGDLLGGHTRLNIQLESWLYSVKVKECKTKTVAEKGHEVKSLKCLCGSHQRLRAHGLLGAGHVGTHCPGCTKVPDLQMKAGIQEKHIAQVVLAQ